MAGEEAAGASDDNDAEKGDETADTLGTSEGLVEEDGAGEAGGHGGEKGNDSCFCDGQVKQ